MKTYTVRVVCEYYVDVDAKSKDEALELAKECELGLPEDINFEIVEVYDYENDGENDALNEYRDMKCKEG